MTAAQDGPPAVVAFAVDGASAPAPDRAAEPAGYLVTVDAAVRLHFLDWGGPTVAGSPEAPMVLLIHGIAQSAAVWAPVARRLRSARRVVAMDLRGHGLSDAPTHGYDADTLAGDVDAVIEASSSAEPGPAPAPARVVLVGHGYGGTVAAWAAATLGDRCAGLVLVDGGWEDAAAATGLEPEELLRTMEEPPEVLRSMAAYLADRAGFDPATWDADQQVAARAAVVEVPAGRVVLAVRPHALSASVDAMFSYRPVQTLGRVRAPIVAIVASDDDGTRHASLQAAAVAARAAGSGPIRVLDLAGSGHNLMRYRPAEVAAAILAIA